MNIFQEYNVDAYNSRLSSFLAACSSHLEPGSVLLTENLASYIGNVSAFKRTVPAAILPSTREEVRLIIECANKNAISLYPISTGKNWGLGSKLPVSDNCVILDLSRMNKIREINLEHGYAVIEPGVTQRQLSNYLIEKKIPYYLDVTGSGSNTSIVGNALERGISYSTCRADKTLRLEIIAGNGELITTGFGHLGNALISHLYRHGIGPSLDGLFYESNFGVVTAMTVKLLPHAEDHLAYTINISDDNNISKVMDAIKKLINCGAITGVPHLFNSARLYPSLAPLVFEYLHAKNKFIGLQQIEKIVTKTFPTPWIVAGSMSGNRKILSASAKVIKKELRGLAKVTCFNDRGYYLFEKLGSLLGSADIKMLIEIMRPLRGASFGIPVDAPLAGVHWAVFADNGYLNRDQEVDLGLAGVLYTSPYCPMQSDRIEELINLTKNICGTFGFNPGIALNAVSANLLEGVISIHFNKQDQNKVEKAHACLRMLNKTYMENHYYLYRADINSMDLVTDVRSPHWQMIKKLKHLFDPNQIISPGRYNLI